MREAIYRRDRVSTRYTRAGPALLATANEAHDTLSRPATRKILEPTFTEYNRTEYYRLAEMQVAYLYRLRHSKSYRTRRTHFTQTKPTPVSIGERRWPEPEDRPGYVRVDTVSQSDRDGVKGVLTVLASHLNHSPARTAVTPGTGPGSPPRRPPAAA